MTIDEIKQFRQLGSKTAGHPGIWPCRRHRDDHRPARPGPRQCGRHGARRAHHERGSSATTSSTTTPMCCAGDGCLMEGISQEAIALAGHLKLNKLIVIWDNNRISIDGAVSLADSTDQIARFAAVRLEHDRISTATIRRRSPRRSKRPSKSDRPTLIAAKTTIGFGAPNKAGTHKVHGSPLGAEEIAGARKMLRLGLSALRDPARHPRRLARGRHASARQRAPTGRSALAAADADKRAEFERRISGDLPGELRRRDRRLQEEARRRQAEGRDPQVVRDGARGHQRRRARDASAARPT